MPAQIVFSFFRCQGYRNKNDVLDFIKIISQSQVKLAQPKFTKTKDGTITLLPFSGNIIDYADQVYEELEVIDGNNISIYDRQGPGIAHANGLIENITTGITETVIFGFSMYGKSFNQIDGVTSAPNGYRDHFAQILLSLAKDFYLRLKPSFGFVDYVTNANSGQIFNEVLSIKTKRIYWANFFGPEYVDKYGKEYLLNAPGWKKELLQDGGILFQLNEHITKAGTQTTLDAVKTYFTKIKVRFVSWPNDLSSTR